MEPEQTFQGQQLQQLQLQLRQLEQQIQFQLQQLQEPWHTGQQNQQQESAQAGSEQLQELEKPISTPQNLQQQSPGKEKQTATYFTVPEMVSTLDIGYLREMLSSNLLAVKQYRKDAENCQLPDLKLQFKEAGQMHFQQYNSLLGFLNENGGTVK